MASNWTQPKVLLVAGAVLLVGSIAAYFLLPRGCSPTSLTQAVECLKKDGTLPRQVVALPAPESGSLLGYRVTHGELERGGSCYGNTTVQDAKSLSNVEVVYDSARSLAQDLRGLGAALKLGLKDTGKVKLVLTDLSISKSTGVFDPLSACGAGTHDVISWELRADEALLVGTKESVRELAGQVDAGMAKASSKLALSDKESFKVIAKNLVFAYLTNKVSTEQSEKVQTWTGEIQPDTAIALPDAVGAQSGLSLKVVSFDRRPGGAFKMRLSGRGAMNARCATGGPGPSLDLSVGIGESCGVSIGDASLLLIQTSFSSGEVKATTTLIHTTRVESPQ